VEAAGTPGPKARIYWRKLVEAAGVEPASESTPSQASTCVAALEISRPSSKSDGNRSTLVPMDLAATRRNSPWRPAGFYDIQSHPAGGDEVDVAVLRVS
jgi:hypothetical protein